MRFGRLPADQSGLAAAPSHRFGAIPAPDILDRRAVDFTPGLYRNDTLPDCSAVGIVNAAGAVAALNGYRLVVEADLVPAFYAGCVGCANTDAAMAATDGAVLLDVLARQARIGFNIGSDLLVGNFGTVNHKNRVSLALAMARFGVGYIGVTLRDRDMQTIGKKWDVQAGRDDGPVAGGHCVINFDYLGLADDDTVRIGTWGAWQAATWSWVMARIDEAHGLVWRQLARADGFYNGVDADGLASDL